MGSSTPPEVNPADAPCDADTTSCGVVQINGDNFVPSANLTCFFRYGSSDDSLRGAAELLSISQVVCTEPDSPMRLHDAIVTVSNDGETESVAHHTRAVYQSSCESCVFNNIGQKECTPTADCTINGKCYQRGDASETDSCYMCNPDSSTDRWTLSTEPRCELSQVCPTAATDVQVAKRDNSVDSDSDKDTVIIALGVACGVLGLLALVAIYSACRSPKMPKGKLLSEEPSPKFDIQRRHVTDPTRPITQAHDNDAAVYIP